MAATSTPHIQVSNQNRVAVTNPKLMEEIKAKDSFRPEETVAGPRLNFFRPYPLRYSGLTSPAPWLKTKHTPRLSHMFLSSRSCAFLRRANIVSFVSKIYSGLPIRTAVAKIRRVLRKNEESAWHCRVGVVRVLLSCSCSKAKRVDSVARGVELNQITQRFAFFHFFPLHYSSRCFQVTLLSGGLL